MRSCAMDPADRHHAPEAIHVALRDTHKGVQRVNLAALRCLKDPIDAEMLVGEGYPSDPSVSAGNLILRVGLRLRVSRNLDKPRGFVNGALGTIKSVLSRCVATVLLDTGKLVLVHPIREGELTFLPCSYGYATTIRKVQGASLDGVVLYFDHSHPPDRGYGYVGASRAKTKAGLYHYGRLRRSDWLPVGKPSEGEATVRGYESMSEECSSEDSQDHDSDYDSDGYEYGDDDINVDALYDEGDDPGPEKNAFDSLWHEGELSFLEDNSDALFDEGDYSGSENNPFDVLYEGEGEGVDPMDVFLVE